MIYVKGKSYMHHDIKTITDPTSIKDDEPFKYLYIFDLRDMPFKDIMCGVYPRLLTWNGTELCSSGIDAREALNS